MMSPDKKTVPIVKWAGGKRQLLPVIEPMLPKQFNTYYEPFFGGGALFCYLRPSVAVINDCNEQLMNIYYQIKNNPVSLCSELSKLQAEYNSKETIVEKDTLYYESRDLFNRYLKDKNLSGDVTSASLFIFLNKTGFNGLYRINSSGMYNVPSAHRKTINTYDKNNVIGLSEILKNTNLLCEDFEKACADAQMNDFVFFDSPYYDVWDSYQMGGFSKEDHLRLFRLFKRLSDKGVYCMLTNNNCDFIKNIYSDFNVVVVDVERRINCKVNGRNGQEVIVTNY